MSLFDLDAVTGDDPKAAKLARVLAFYAERLPVEERDLLARLSVFPRGVTLEILRTIVDAGGEVAGVLVDAKQRLINLLTNLKMRGVVFESYSDTAITWTAHPFLRETFRELIGCPAEKVFEIVAQSIGSGLEKRPSTKPTDSSILDRYERLIEATRLAGREEDAFELYWYGIGGFAHLGQALGEYQRGYRIVSGFSATGRTEDIALTLPLRQRCLLVNALALFGMKLGRLADAWFARQMFDRWAQALGEVNVIAAGLRNSIEMALELARLKEAHLLANAILMDRPEGNRQEAAALSARAAAAHLIGDVASSDADFAAATEREGEPLFSLRGARHVRRLLDVGNLSAARSLCETGLRNAGDWIQEAVWFQALHARIDLAETRDPSPRLDQIRAWTLRTGEIKYIIEAHLLTARHLQSVGDYQAALHEADSGLVHAVACGYGLLGIELLIALARIRLAWPDPPKAIQAAREALDLATDPDCGFAWGEADAAQVWGEAYLANYEPTLAKRAFERALAVRKRIRHPGIAETEEWLARAG